MKCTVSIAMAMFVVMMFSSSALGWDPPILVSDQVTIPESIPGMDELTEDSTQMTFDLDAENGGVYLAYAEWDPIGYRHITGVCAYDEQGEVWRTILSPQFPYHSAAPSQVKLWRGKVYVVGQLTQYDSLGHWGALPFVARLNTNGQQEWFTPLTAPFNNGLLWGPQLSINPINRVGMVYFSTPNIHTISNFQLFNLETGAVNGPPFGYTLELYPTVGYCQLTPQPAWVSGAWRFVHRCSDYLPVVMGTVTADGITRYTPVDWTQYSSLGVFALGVDSLQTVVVNLSGELVLLNTSLDGRNGPSINLTRTMSGVWAMYDSFQTTDGTIITVIIWERAVGFSADIAMVTPNDNVIHCLFPFDALPASCHGNVIGDQTVGLVRSVDSQLIFSAINTDGTVVWEEAVGATSPDPATVNWSKLAGDGNGGAFIAWYVEAEQGVSFPGSLYLQWLSPPSQQTPVATGLTVLPRFHASPNPFNPATSISFTLPNSDNVKLTVFDINGRQVATLVNGWREAGAHSVTFDGLNLASGIYFYHIKVGGFTATQKMVLTK